MRRICWDQRLVRQLFTTEADTKLTRDSFLRLHQPFDRIRVVSTKPYVFPPDCCAKAPNDSFVTEQDLLEAVKAAPLTDPNRIFVLTGEPGSGKSHLARWLYFMLSDQPDRFPIHIPRRINSLVAVLNQLIEVAGLKLDEEPSAYLTEAPVIKVVRYLTAYLDMSVGPGSAVGERLPLLSRVLARPEFESILARQVARYQASRRTSAADGPDLIALPEDEFARLAPGGTLTERTEAYALLRRHMNQALRKVSNLDRLDLQGELVRISRALVTHGKRPVLILEDITSFDLLHDDLLTFLLDEAAGHFDALVCWTTGYEKAYLRTHQLDRYTARLSLSSADKEVYSLQGDGFKRLVQGYLDAVKPWCKPGECDLYERCIPAFEGLYPFNPAALERIYENLLGSDMEERRTPRNLLDRAVKSYLEIAEGHGQFPPLHQPPVVKDILYPEELFRHRDAHPSFVAMTAWYGQLQDGAIHLAADIPQLLGVHLPETYRQDGDRILSTEHTEEKGPTLSPLMTSPLPSHPVQRMEPVASPTDNATELALSNRMKELRLEVQSWVSSLKIPAHDHELLRGLQKLFSLFKLRFPVPLGHPAGLLAGVTYGKAQAESNLTLAGTRGKTSPLLQVMILPTDPAALERDAEVWQAALDLSLTGKLGERTDLALLSYWCHQRYEAYRKQAAERLEATLGSSLERWVLSAHWMLSGILKGQTEGSYATLVESDPGPTLPPELLPSALSSDELRSLSEQVARLFHACFGVASGILDAPRILRVRQASSPEAALVALASVTHSRIDPDFRVGMATPFRDVVRLVKQVATALLQGDPTPHYQRIAQEMNFVITAVQTNPESLDDHVKNLRRLIGLTGRYDLYDPESGRAWDDDHAYISQMQAQLSVLQELVSSRPATLWQYLHLAKRMFTVRQSPGYAAALAIGSWTAHLQRSLGLTDSPNLASTLERAVANLRQAVPTPRENLEQSLLLLEEFCRESRDAEVRQAVRLLRERLLA